MRNATHEFYRQNKTMVRAQRNLVSDIRTCLDQHIRERELIRAQGKLSLGGLRTLLFKINRSQVVALFVCLINHDDRGHFTDDEELDTMFEQLSSDAFR